jgi:hypothetical protein
MKNNSGVIQRLFEYLKQKYYSTAAHVPEAQGEMRMKSTTISMSQKWTAEVDEFIYMQPNGIIMRNT